MAITLKRHRSGAETREPQTREAQTRVLETRPAGPAMVYERQVGAGLLGLTAVLVGAWGLICGYIGPYFGFRPIDDHVWTGSLQEGLLHAVLGA